MGGRGSASGMSDKGKPYGTEYETLYQAGNIKYVRYRDGSTTAPMETMTKNRIYARLIIKAMDCTRKALYFTAVCRRNVKETL